MTPILIKPANGINLQPLLNVLEHAGHRAEMMSGGTRSGLSFESPTLIFTEVTPSNAQEMEGLHQLHQQIPDAKIIALVNPAETDDHAVQKCAEQPGVFRAFKDPFNSGGLMEVVDSLCPLDSD